MIQTPQWLQLVQAIGAMATTVGVLTALYIAVIRDPRKASKEHQDHVERMEALRRAKKERAGAQARKVVPSCGRIPMFGDSWWTVRIDNASNAMATILGVTVNALDANGFEIPGGYRQANDTVPFDQAFERAVSPARSESRNDLVPAFKEAVRDALAGHLVKRWPRTLAPNHYAVMAYTTADPTYELRITLDYEDEAGYRWRRTDSCRPRRMDEERNEYLAPIQ
ncbi:hypothetical protein [Mycobacterium sp.]|uniref:hypothetical protein n=1 Tax=Mycobacterium sp. TaxID=1785 RepID=UPI003C77B5A5